MLGLRVHEPAVPRRLRRLRRHFSVPGRKQEDPDVRLGEDLCGRPGEHEAADEHHRRLLAGEEADPLVEAHGDRGLWESAGLVQVRPPLKRADDGRLSPAAVTEEKCPFPFGTEAVRDERRDPLRAGPLLDVAQAYRRQTLCLRLRDDLLELRPCLRDADAELSKNVLVIEDDEGFDPVRDAVELALDGGERDLTADKLLPPAISAVVGREVENEAALDGYSSVRARDRPGPDVGTFAGSHGSCEGGVEVRATAEAAALDRDARVGLLEPAVDLVERLADLWVRAVVPDRENLLLCRRSVRVVAGGER